MALRGNATGKVSMKYFRGTETSTLSNPGHMQKKTRGGPNWAESTPVPGTLSLRKENCFVAREDGILQSMKQLAAVTAFLAKPIW